MKTAQQYSNKFGLPTINGTGYLVTIDLSFPLRIAWDTNTKVNTIEAVAIEMLKSLEQANYSQPIQKFLLSPFLKYKIANPC